MHILFMNASYWPNYVGGAERVVQRLAETLTERGHKATVVTAQQEGDERIEFLNGVRVHYLPVSNVYQSIGGAGRSAVRRALWHALDTYNVNMARSVSNLIRVDPPDVINTHNLVGLSVAAIAAGKERGVPIVHTLHDQYLLCPRSTMFKRGRNCRRWCTTCRLYALPRRIVSSRVDVVVGVSKFILERHLGHGYFRGAEARVIYNGVPIPETRAWRDDEHSRPLRFGFLGQLRETKGLHTLVEAFSDESFRGAELLIAGTGDSTYERSLRNRTTKSDSIRWLGFVKATEFFGMIDVLVVPSLWRDTAPLVVLEAAAHSVPVVGAARGGIPEFITRETGWTYDPDEPDGLRRTLKQCMGSKDRFAEMGAAARVFAERFNTRFFVERYLEVYGCAISRADGRALPIS